MLACGIGTKFEDIFRLTNSGIKLHEFGLKPLNKNTLPNK